MYYKGDVGYNGFMTKYLSPKQGSNLIVKFGSKFKISSDQASSLLDWVRDEGDELTGFIEETILSYYMDNGQMPYEVAKAVTADPLEWVKEQLKREFDL